MARETVIPSISVEVVKEVVPPSPAATGIVAILGSTENGPILIPTRIDRFPTFKEIFGAGSVYSMPEVKYALQNGAKELVIVRLGDKNGAVGGRAYIELDSETGGKALLLTARAEGIWGNEILVQIKQGKSTGTYRLDLYYQTDEPLEIFDNLSMNPEEDRYIVNIINTQSDLVTATDLTGLLPKTMPARQSLTGGTDGKRSKLTLKATAADNSIKDVFIIRIKEYSLEEDNEDEIQITIAGAEAGPWDITIKNITQSKQETLTGLTLDANANTIVNAINLSAILDFVEAEEVDDGYSYDAGDKLNLITDESLTGWAAREPATYTLKDDEGYPLILVTGKDPDRTGESGDNYAVRIIDGSAANLVTLKIFKDSIEILEIQDLDKDPASPNYIIKKVNNSTPSYVELSYLTETEKLAIINTPENFTGGTNPEVKDYETGLTGINDIMGSGLEVVPDVDIVVPSIQYPPPSDFPNGHFDDSQDIFAAVDAHCKKMSEAANNRIGFGEVSRMELPTKSAERTNTIGSDRFVILAPHGVVGAVAGLIGSMTYYYSPTFKPITGFTTLERDFSPTDLRTLLRANIVPLDAKRGLGIIIIRGLTTDGDQISVRRVADYAVRNVKNIAERFIGNLNTQDGRDALKQKIIEFLRQMEKDTALVPSTDGTDPAFKVDVYSTQRDFALGIVRVDIAVRPVRAIDFIYATILVQV